MIATPRVLIRGGWLALHIAIAFPVVLLCLCRPRLKRRLFQWWLTGVCRILRVRVTMHGSPRHDSLIVPNHVSWLDIPVLASVWRGDFLAKEEVGSWPVIGWLVRRSGSVLIRRGCAASCGQAIIGMSGRLGRGGGVCMFPEGTTTDGRTLRRFQPRLFTAATRAGARVQPVALRYFDAEGRLHAAAPFIGDDDFATHVLRLLRGPALHAELVFLPPISTRGQAPRSLAESAHRRVAETLDRCLRCADRLAMPGIDDEALAASRLTQ